MGTYCDERINLVEEVKLNANVLRMACSGVNIATFDWILFSENVFVELPCLFYSYGYLKM